MSDQEACEQCNATIPKGSEIILEGKKDQPETVLCSTCASSLEKTIEEETENIKVFRAVIFGFFVALISALIWYGAVVITKYELGIVAIAVGWLVARSVIWGAGGKRGPVIQFISVVFIVLAMGFSEYLIVRHFYIQTLSKEAADHIPLLLPLEDMLNIIVGYIKADPVVLVFWLIAIIEGIVLPAKRKLKLKRPYAVEAPSEK